MNARVPENKVLELSAPKFLERRAPARFGWWSDRTMMIAKGDDVMTLDADDLAGLRAFVAQFDQGDAA